MNPQAAEIVDLMKDCHDRFRDSPQRGTTIINETRVALNQKAQSGAGTKAFKSLCSSAEGFLGLCEDFHKRGGYDSLIEAGLPHLQLVAETV